jgi:hypothetical protein
MIISLIHPSRGRAKKAFKTYSDWMLKSSCSHTIEHILSVDFDDIELKGCALDFGKSARVVCQQTCGLRSVSKKIPRDEPAKKKELLCFVP